MKTYLLKILLLLALFAPGVSQALDLTAKLNNDNATAQAYLDEIRQTRQQSDARDGIATVEPATSVSLPDPVIEYIAVRGDGLSAVPFVPIPESDVQIVVRTTDQFSKYQVPVPNYQLIRASYGGVMPYTVVRSNQPFVIVSQTNDVLVVGDPNPAAAMVSDNRDWRLDQAYGNRVALVPPSPNTLFVNNRLNLGAEMPPGVPGNIVLMTDLHSFYPGSVQEPFWAPNGKLCRRDPLLTCFNGRTAYDVYQVDLR